MVCLTRDQSRDSKLEKAAEGSLHNSWQQLQATDAMKILCFTGKRYELRLYCLEMQYWSDQRQGAKERNHPGSVAEPGWEPSRVHWLQLQLSQHHSGSISSHKFSGAPVEQGPADKQGLTIRLRPTTQPVLLEPGMFQLLITLWKPDSVPRTSSFRKLVTKFHTLQKVDPAYFIQNVFLPRSPSLLT